VRDLLLITRFVAKPIGRLGGPGLIPTAFVEIRDPSTGRAIQVSPETIPMVEEWKKATADYKAAAIPLGRFDMADQGGVVDSPYAPNRQSHQASSGANSQTSLPRSGSTSSVGNVNGNGTGTGNGINHNQRATPVYRPEEDATLPMGEITSLAVPSFHNESGNYQMIDLLRHTLYRFTGLTKISTISKSPYSTHSHSKPVDLPPDPKTRIHQKGSYPTCLDLLRRRLMTN
jgi:hypothetical protein